MTDGQIDGGRSSGTRTFIEEARRRQIVQCAVDVIAELGYANATLARIAERAGVSKGVISYHFEGKDDLIFQVLADYDTAEKAYLFPKVEAQETASDALRAYLVANVEYMAVHPKHLKAVVEIVIGAQDSEGQRKFDITSVEWTEGEIAYLEEILRRGQESGEFRRFCERVMAVAIRGAIENIAMHMLTYDEIDMSTYASELAETFMLATRAEEPGRTPATERERSERTANDQSERPDETLRQHCSG